MFFSIAEQAGWYLNQKIKFCHETSSDSVSYHFSVNVVVISLTIFLLFFIMKELKFLLTVVHTVI